MERKAVFLDIDGTLVGFDGRMPESAKKALEQARRNGHKMFICTGRPYGMVDPWLLGLGFDGVVASAGAYVRTRELVVFHQTLELAYVRQVMAVIKDHGALFMLHDRDHCYLSPGFYQFMEARDGNMGKKGKRMPGEVMFEEGMELPKELASLDYFGADITVEEIQAILEEKMPGYFAVTGSSFGSDHTYCGEITRRGTTKGSGMEKMLTHFGMCQADSIGVGDGMNDMDMLRYADMAVAMGNSVEPLKELADLVTDPIDQDGLWNGFRKLGLI